MSVLVLKTYTAFNLSNGNVFICFNMIINKKSEKSEKSNNLNSNLAP